MTETTNDPPVLETEQAGVLRDGDEFQFQPGGPGTTRQVFTFRGVKGDKHPHVSCYGGDKNPKGDRQWRAFSVERVVAEAKPAGHMASKRSA